MNVQIDNAKMKAAGKIILDGILDLMATKNGVSIEFVVSELQAGNIKALAQFKQVAEYGVDLTLEMAKNGQISLTKIVD
jgi:hypothetical protein